MVKTFKNIFIRTSLQKEIYIIFKKTYYSFSFQLLLLSLQENKNIEKLLDMKQLIQLTFLLLTTCAAYAQNFQARRITINDGLSSNSITSLLQDSDGYIWIGTNNGLCRYDGYNILLFKNISPDKSIPTDPHIGNLRKDANNMYVETSDGSIGTYHFISSRFVDYQTKSTQKGKKKKTPKDLFRKSYQGYTYVYTSSSKLQTYDSHHHLVNEHTAHIQEIIDGTYYLSDQEGTLWIFPQEGNIQKLNLLSNARYTTNKRHKYYVAKNGKSEFIIATYGNGLFRYNSSNGSLTHYTAQDLTPVILSNFLTSLLIDRDGCIWTGSEETGISCISLSQGNDVRYIFPESSAKGDWSNYIRSLYVVSDEEAYIGTQQDKIYKCNLVTGKSSLIKETRDMIFDIMKDRKGHLWIGTRGDGLYVDDIHYTPTSTTHHIPADKIYDIVEDKMGRIWIATWDKGILLAEGTQACSKQKTVRTNIPLHFTEFLNKKHSQNRIHDLELGKNGILWIATNDGIYTVDTNRKNIQESDFQAYNLANRLLPGNEIICLQTTQQGKLYAGITGVGLVECLLDAQHRIKGYDVLNNRLKLNMNVINSIEQDRYGYLWIGTELGIFRLSLDYYKIQKYEYSTTITSNSYSENTSAITPSGKLVFGTRNGLVIINPAQTLEKEKTYPCLITDLQINGKSIFNDDNPKTTNLKENSIELAHNQNSINIYFSCFNYKSSFNLYQYYLEGINRSWLEPGTQNHINYSDLPPGKYVFHVRSLINGVPQEETAFTIVITPPFYATWWAISLYLIILGLVVYRIYSQRLERFRMNQQIKIEKQLTEFRLNFFTHVAHEFRTPLAIIQGGIERLNNNKGTEYPQAAIASATRGTQRLLRLINQILEFRKVSDHAIKLNVSKGDIIEFILQLHKDFWNMANQKEISLTFTPFAKHYEVCFDHEKLETIIYNLLSNAVKYTAPKGNISMKMTHNEGLLTLTISNSGEGINTENREHLFQPFMHGYTSQGGMGIGLYLSQQYAEKHKGKLSYRYDKENKQNTFELTLPDNNDAYAPDDYQASVTRHSTEANKKVKEEMESIIREMQGEALNTQHIAIIEDDTDMMEQLKRDISPYFKPDCYLNGQQGYEGVISNPPALIICDVMLPDLNGYDIVTRLRSTTYLKNVPVILLTALDDEEHQIKGYKSGADDYMTKPYNERILITRIIQLIKWNLANVAHEVKNNASTSAESTPPPTSGTMKEVILESKADKLFRETVMKLIVQNISEPEFTVDKLAEKMHMGRTKFFGKMKELTGMSPNKYLQSERMRIAGELLSEGKYNVSEVALMVGIQDSSYFYKCFKSKYGIPPSKYAQTQMVEKEDTKNI